MIIFGRINGKFVIHCDKMSDVEKNFFDTACNQMSNLSSYYDWWSAEIHSKNAYCSCETLGQWDFINNYEITFTAEINQPSYSLPSKHLYRFPNAYTFSSWQGVTDNYMSEYEIRELLKSLPDWSNDGDGSYSSSHEIYISFGGSINYDRQQEIVRLFNEKGWAIYY